jgi:NADPH:quinone reductase-like Zn-dependent oxidoreductase
MEALPRRLDSRLRPVGVGDPREDAHCGTVRARGAVPERLRREMTMSAPVGTPLTMQAIVQAEYGSADVLRLEEIERPTVGKDEVLIRVHAAGLDRGTWHQMAGEPYLFRVMGIGLRAPKNPVPGLDVAGTVEAVGNDVTRFAIGDEVYGISKGSFAEYARAREDKLARKPGNLSFDQSGAVGVSGLTALQSLRATSDASRQANMC